MTSVQNWWNSGGSHRPGLRTTVLLALAPFAAVVGFITAFTQYIQSAGWLSAIVLAAAVLAGLVTCFSIFSKPGRSRNVVFLFMLCTSLACTVVLLTTSLSPFLGPVRTDAKGSPNAPSPPQNTTPPPPPGVSPVNESIKF
jgi:cytochrome bd-type quinol oxidase subunit 2